MKAFKTYAQLPENQRPLGVPLALPFQQQDCSEQEVNDLQSKGFIVLSDSEYTQYLANNSVEFSAWEVLETRRNLKPVTPRQIRQALLLQGLSLETIENALNSLPEPTKSLALIEWEYSLEFQRNRPLVNSVAQLLGMTDEQLDTLWVFAASL